MTTNSPADPLDAALAAAFGPNQDWPQASGFLAALGAGVGMALPILSCTLPAEAAPSAASEPGDGARYHLYGEIARGGMGVLMHGRDNHLQRDVAVKVLREEHRDNPDLRRRFLGEARIGGQLQHPGVAPVYELGRFDDRRPYFSMKLVKGRTLAELLTEHPGPRDSSPLGARVLGTKVFALPSEALNGFLVIFEQVCQTVAYAHSKGIIHRDLKPANIMIGEFGEVLVMDWGLAKQLQPMDHETRQEDAVPRAGTATAETAGETRPGTVMGTPAYMSPEQARGEVDRLDARCDVFALGAILCEILTGKPPYEGADVTEIRRKAESADVTAALIWLNSCRADEDLIRLVKDCLAPQEVRLADAGVVVERMTAFRKKIRSYADTLADSFASGAVKVQPAPGPRWSRHLLEVVGFGLVGILVAITWWFYKEQQAELREKERQVERLQADLNAAKLAGTLILLGSDQAKTDLRQANDRLSSYNLATMAHDHFWIGVNNLKSGKADEAGGNFLLSADTYRAAFDKGEGLWKFRLDPGINPYIEFGLSLLYSGKPSDAGAQFDEALRLEPKHRDTFADMIVAHGRLTLAAGHREVAQAAFREANRIRPGNVNLEHELRRKGQEP